MQRSQYHIYRRGVKKFWRTKVPGFGGFDVFKALALGPYSRTNSLQIIPLRLYDFFLNLLIGKMEIENWASNIFTVGADK